jgi:hypothetical protein
MPLFLVKVPNGDDGEDLGEFESDCVPRVGDDFVLFHPRLCGSSDHPFVGKVGAVVHEASSKDHKYATNTEKNTVITTVWLVEEAPAPMLYCDCTSEERKQHGENGQGRCENCGHERDDRPVR